MPVAFGRYQLNTRIASGGMGEVFLARRGDETLVVKRLLPHLTADAMARARFVDEARIASAVRHPNLVKILELGQVDVAGSNGGDPVRRSRLGRIVAAVTGDRGPEPEGVERPDP